jgi:multidrug resistance protein, MATE family
MLAAVSVPLMGIADTAMVGHLSEVAFLGAVSTAGLIFSVLFWSTGFLRMGTTSMVAQFYGAQDRRSCIHMLYRSLGLACILGILLVVLGHFGGPAAFSLAGGSAEVQEWGMRYFVIRLWEAPLVLALFALNGFFLGTANAWAPMAVTVVANGINILADYILIYGMWGAPVLGVEGAAWASVLANVIASVLALVLLVVLYRPYRSQPLRGVWDKAAFVLIFRTNSHLFGRTLCLQFAQFFLLGLVSRMGEVPLAANAVVLQFWALSSFAVDGLAHAAETLVGSELGGRRFAAARQMAGRIIVWGMGVGAGFGLIFLAFIAPLARLFTPHEDVVQAVVDLRWLIGMVQPLNAVVFVFDGIFIGANDMRYLFGAMAVASFGFFLPLALLFTLGLDWGMSGAWAAYNGLMIGRFLTLWPRYRGDAWLKTFVV